MVAKQHRTVSRETALGMLDIWCDWRRGAISLIPAQDLQGREGSKMIGTVDDPDSPWAVLIVEAVLAVNPHLAVAAHRLYLHTGEISRRHAYRRRTELLDAICDAVSDGQRFDGLTISQAAIIEVRERRKQRTKPVP